MLQPALVVHTVSRIIVSPGTLSVDVISRDARPHKSKKDPTAYVAGAHSSKSDGSADGPA